MSFKLNFNTNSDILRLKLSYPVILSQCFVEQNSFQIEENREITIFQGGKTLRNLQ